MLQGKLVGTVDKANVTKDEVLGMIIMGKKPDEVTQKELGRSTADPADSARRDAGQPPSSRRPRPSAGRSPSDAPERRRQRRVELPVASRAPRRSAARPAPEPRPGVACTTRAGGLLDASGTSPRRPPPGAPAP